jgi:O-antigen/teichoic acid export membrane protein
MLGLALAVGCGLAFFLSRAEERRQGFAVAFKRDVVRDMTHFTFANYVSALLWSGPGLILPLLVINALGPEANAYFYVAWSVGGLIAMIPMAFSWSLFAHGSHDSHRLEAETLAGAKFVLLLLVPAVAAVFLLGDKVLLLFGPSYSQEGLQLLRVLSLSTVPMAVNFLYFSVRRVQQRMGGVIVSTLWILIVTLGLSVLLLPRIGLLGAGVAWLVAQASVAALLLGRFAFNR